MATQLMCAMKAAIRESECHEDRVHCNPFLTVQILFIENSTRPVAKCKTAVVDVEYDLLVVCPLVQCFKPSGRTMLVVGPSNNSPGLTFCINLQQHSVCEQKYIYCSQLQLPREKNNGLFLTCRQERKLISMYTMLQGCCD
jgi:hypothetical protein